MDSVASMDSTLGLYGLYGLYAHITLKNRTTWPLWTLWTLYSRGFHCVSIVDSMLGLEGVHPQNRMDIIGKTRMCQDESYAVDGRNARSERPRMAAYTAPGWLGWVDCYRQDGLG